MDEPLISQVMVDTLDYTEMWNCTYGISAPIVIQFIPLLNHEGMKFILYPNGSRRSFIEVRAEYIKKILRGYQTPGFENWELPVEDLNGELVEYLKSEQSLGVISVNKIKRLLAHAKKTQSNLKIWEQSLQLLENGQPQFVFYLSSSSDRESPEYRAGELKGSFDFPETASIHCMNMLVPYISPETIEQGMALYCKRFHGMDKVQVSFACPPPPQKEVYSGYWFGKYQQRHPPKGPFHVVLLPPVLAQLVPKEKWADFPAPVKYGFVKDGVYWVTLQNGEEYPLLPCVKDEG